MTTKPPVIMSIKQALEFDAANEPPCGWTEFFRRELIEDGFDTLKLGYEDQDRLNSEWLRELQE